MRCSKCGYENKEGADSIRKMGFAGLWLEIGIIIIMLCISRGVYAFGIIPSISGQVVDAVTGEPLPGIEVRLFASCSASFGCFDGGEELRNEYCVTDRKGKFHFPWSFRKNPIFTNYHGHFLLVNYKTHNYLDTAPLTYILIDTLLNREKGRDVIGNKKYFPIKVFFHPEKSFYSDPIGDASSYYFPKTHNIRVALIPVLDNVSICDQIKDPEVKEKCKLLNTFLSAFLKLETPEDMAKAKELCKSIDRNISKKCLQSLEVYAANHPSIQRETVPPDMFILKSIAEIDFSYSRVSRRDIFNNNYEYLAYYSAGNQNVSVTIEQFNDEAETKVPHSRYHGEGMSKNSPREGIQKRSPLGSYRIYYHDEIGVEVAYWTSGSKTVCIAFMRSYNAILKQYFAPSAAQQAEFIRQYMIKYPSSL